MSILKSIRWRSIAAIFLAVILLAVAYYYFIGSVPPAATIPDKLYVLDVSDLHINHYEHCLALTGASDACDTKTPPPEGKTHQDLLREYDILIFLTTTQGIINRDTPQLYLNHDHQRDDELGVDAFWLEKYQMSDQAYGWLAETEIIELEAWTDVLELFADDLTGVVLWDTNVPATLNVATTIAGVEGWPVVRAGSEIEVDITAQVPVRTSLVGMFEPGATTVPDSDTPSTGSAKADAYLWAKEKYLDTGRANAQFLAYLLDGWPAWLYSQDQMTRGGVYAFERDYVVQQRGFALDLSPWPNELPNDDPEQPLGADATAFQAVITAAQAQSGGGVIKIWGFIPWYEKYAVSLETGIVGQSSAVKGEWESTWQFSQRGGYLQGGGGDVFGVAMANISVHKFGPHPAARPYPKPPTEADLIQKGYLTTDGQVNPDYTFVLFYAGDYDLVHPVYTLMANYARKPWLDEKRGEIPLAWGFNPGMVEDIPGIMTYLYETQTENDYFVASNSGAGYLNPDGPSEVTLLRWLLRSRNYFARYGYDVQGFLLNGNGAAMSQKRIDAYTLLAPQGILVPDFEADEPWPRLQWGVPLTTLASEALFGTPEIGAQAVHTVYKRVVLEEGRPPFLAFRSAFQSSSLLWGIREQMQAHQAEGSITDENGQVIHPNYEVVDPYTFFFLVERYLEQGAGN